MAVAGYTGRFAPSPTGPLHAGSLFTAAASYLRARQAGGRWLVRIEDIDPPREIAGASADILRTLERFGFEWDGDVRYQSTRLSHYRERLAELGSVTYRCTCTRRDIADAARRLASPPGHYPGLCRDKQRSGAGAIRVRFDAPPAFHDALQGTITSELVCDDFIVWRRDDLPAYQWAVTIDDAEQGISEVVRGCDLLGTTARQAFLHGQLQYPTPRFMHVPVLINEQGQKLSKQTGALALAPDDEARQLCATFSQLGLPVCDAPIADGLSDLWLWAIRHWDHKSLKMKDTIPFVKP